MNTGIFMRIGQDISNFIFVKPRVWVLKQLFQCLFEIAIVNELDFICVDTQTPIWLPTQLLSQIALRELFLDLGVDCGTISINRICGCLCNIKNMFCDICGNLILTFKVSTDEVFKLSITGYPKIQLIWLLYPTAGQCVINLFSHFH